jgi:methyl-accepting chemotaxis protein
MPSNYVKSLAKDTDKSEKEIEKLWDKAKEVTSETFGKKESDFGEKEWKYTTGVVKNMLGIKESINQIDFYNSDMTAEKYIETLTSNVAVGNANIDLIAKKPEDEEDQENIKKVDLTDIEK